MAAPRTHRTVAIAAAAASIVVVAVTVAGGHRQHRSGTVAAPPGLPAAAVPLVPPGGRDAALAAGVADATLLARLLPLPPAAATALADQVASAAYRPALSAAVAAELEPLQRQVAGLAGTPVYRQCALAAQLVSFTPPRAQVRVWTMLVAGQAGVDDNATATFATVTVDLVAEGGAWKLDGTSEQPGPSPQVSDAPTSVDTLDARLDGFADWRPTP